MPADMCYRAWALSGPPTKYPISGAEPPSSRANSGLGLIEARELARRGAHVFIASRDHAKAEAAAAAIRHAVPSASLEVAQLDLADLGSVQTFTQRFLAGHARLDLLINNAGVMAAPYQRTVDGFELQFGTNHLGH